MDQPGVVGIPTCGQLNGKDKHFPVPASARIWSRDTGLAAPSRVSPLLLHFHSKSGIKVDMGNVATDLDSDLCSTGTCRAPASRLTTEIPARLQ